MITIEELIRKQEMLIDSTHIVLKNAEKLFEIYGDDKFQSEAVYLSETLKALIKVKECLINYDLRGAGKFSALADFYSRLAAGV